MRNNPTKSELHWLAPSRARHLSSLFLNLVQTHRHGSTMRVASKICKRIVIVTYQFVNFSNEFSVNFISVGISKLLSNSTKAMQFEILSKPLFHNVCRLKGLSTGAREQALWGLGGRGGLRSRLPRRDLSWHRSWLAVKGPRLRF